jgi:hypothetical protein
MLCRLPLAGDVSRGTWHVEELCGEDLVDEKKSEVGFGVGVIEVDMHHHFDTGKSCVARMKSLSNVLCTCERHPSQRTQWNMTEEHKLNYCIAFFIVFFIILCPPLLFCATSG